MSWLKRWRRVWRSMFVGLRPLSTRRIPRDRERIARLYRHARVLVHESRDGQVSIVADVPRRLLGRLDLPKR